MRVKTLGLVLALPPLSVWICVSQINVQDSLTMPHPEAMQGSVASTATPCTNQTQMPLPLHKTSLVSGFGSVTMVLEVLRAQKELFKFFSAQ